MSQAQLKTDWLKLSSAEIAIEVKAIESNSCHICGRAPWIKKSCESFEVRQCQKCDAYVCEDDAQVDHDSDQDGFFVSSWICKRGCEEVK